MKRWSRDAESSGSDIHIIVGIFCVALRAEFNEGIAGRRRRGLLSGRYSGGFGTSGSERRARVWGRARATRGNDNDNDERSSAEMLHDRASADGARVDWKEKSVEGKA